MPFVKYFLSRYSDADFFLFRNKPKGGKAFKENKQQANTQVNKSFV